jgi:hypothetical protein
LLCLSLRIFCCLTIALMIAETAGGQVDANASAPSVKVDADGTVHIPPQTVPLSSYLSPEAHAYVTYRLLLPDPPPDPDVNKERARIDAHLAPLIDKQKECYPVDVQPATCIPHSGIYARLTMA